MNRLTLSIASIASLLTMLHSFNIQPPHRRGPQSNNNLAEEWLASTRVPAFAVLPTTGAIVEVNREASHLFPKLPLLELDLPQLFPNHGAEVHQALGTAQRNGAASVEVSVNGGSPLTLVLSSAPPATSPLVGFLLPAPQRESRSPSDSEGIAGLPPLSLAYTLSGTPISQQLSGLLEEVVQKWPVTSAAILRRQSMALQPLMWAGEKVPWNRLQLPTTDLGSLLHDGMPAQSKLDDYTLLLHPLHLAARSGPWGIVALAYSPEEEQGDRLRTGIAQVARSAGLVMGRARLESQKQKEKQDLSELVAIRNHLLARSRRGVLLLDKDHRIVAINEAASTLLSWPAEDVTGRPLPSLLDSLGPLGNKIADCLKEPAEEGGQAMSGRLQRPGKRGRDVGFALERTQEAPDYLLLFLEDQEGMAAFTETQHHLDRLAILGQMSATIAHDLRNPLSSILYGIESLAESLGEDHPETEHIQLLLAEGDRVHRIIEDILSVSRQPSLTISLCSLRTLMDQVYDTHQRQLKERDIHVRRYYDPALPLIEGDPVRLQQMLGNLINNAIEALPEEDGQLEIVLRPLMLDQMIARGISPEQEERLQGGVEILIRDNGPGIPESQREQIFEPLFTTKSNGTGLGLPIVRTIVEQHRGLIFLDSESERGTSFQIFLPQLSVSNLRET